MTGPRDPTLTLILNAALPLLHLAYEQVLRTIEAALQAYGTHAPAGLADLLDALHAVGKDGEGRAKLTRLLAEAIARHPEATDPASQVIAAVLAALTAVDGEEQPGAAAAPDAAEPPALEKGDAPPADVATAGRGPAGFDPLALTRQQLLREVLRALALDPGRFYTRLQITRYLIVQKGGLGEREVNLVSQRFSEVLQELKRRHWVTSKGPHNKMGYAITEAGRAALAELSASGDGAVLPTEGSRAPMAAWNGT